MRPALLLIWLAVAVSVTARVRAQTWVQKVGGPGLGNPLAVNPLNTDIIYGAAGSSRIYISRDRGYTWTEYGNPISGGGIIKSIAVSPVDTLLILAGMESNVGSPDRIVKSTDGGSTWTQTWSGTFSYFGQPVEFSPAHPDTVYTMGLDTVYRSVDFGSTWDTVATGRGFNAWCDASIRPDSASILYIGDNLSGIWKTTDHGSTWKQTYVSVGEIPSIAIDPLSPSVAYAGKFGGGGGVIKTTDWGETWHSLDVPSGSRDAWWVACSPFHPGYVYYGTYTADTLVWGIYISRDAGETWQRIREGLPQTARFNYGLLALDSLTVLALQANGIFKYQYPTTLQMLFPSGGEHLLSDSDYVLSWAAAGLYYVRLEYSTDNGTSWFPIADSIPVSQTSYPWMVPDVVSESCLVRVSDALFTGTSDESDSVFSITGAPITVIEPNGGEQWGAGSLEAISWISLVLDSILVEYSTDAGSSWNTASRVAPWSGDFPWIVPDVHTDSALVRLRAEGDTAVMDVSDAYFSIILEEKFLGALAVADNGDGTDTLVFGVIPGATDGIDSLLGESELSSVPPAGTFDTRWSISGTEGSRTDFRDTLHDQIARNVYTARAQPGPGGYPMTFSWNPESLKAGVFILKNVGGTGDGSSTDMRRRSAVTVEDTEVISLEIVQCAGTDVAVTGGGGWVLTSLPVETGDCRVTALFPLASTKAYAYMNGYEKRDTMRQGTGYWIKTEQVMLHGCPTLLDTFDVVQGWNMVGSITRGVDPASIITEPESLLVSPFFGFGAAGYIPADTIRPGSGYWVKSCLAGRIFLDASITRASVEIAPPAMMPGMGSITVWGENLDTTTLYFGPDDQGSCWEAPPAPPNGRKRANFKGGYLGIFHKYFLNFPIEYEIQTDSLNFTIFFSWNVDIHGKFTYILVEKAGTHEVFSTLLKGSGSITRSKSEASRYYLRVHPRVIGSTETPRRFSMGQVFPNPFNPSTRVMFSLPSESIVSYKIFNLLGEVIVSADDVHYPEGENYIVWDGKLRDGTAPGSGLYFFVLTVRRESGSSRTGDVVQTGVRKLMLLR